jgi:hypothetical protein
MRAPRLAVEALNRQRDRSACDLHQLHGYEGHRDDNVRICRDPLTRHEAPCRYGCSSRSSNTSSTEMMRSRPGTAVPRQLSHGGLARFSVPGTTMLKPATTDASRNLAACPASHDAPAAPPEPARFCSLARQGRAPVRVPAGVRLLALRRGSAGVPRRARRPRSRRPPGTRVGSPRPWRQAPPFRWPARCRSG